MEAALTPALIVTAKFFAFVLMDMLWPLIGKRVKTMMNAKKTTEAVINCASTHLEAMSATVMLASESWRLKALVKMSMSVKKYLHCVDTAIA